MDSVSKTSREIEDARLRVENERWKKEADFDFIRKVESNLMSVSNLAGLYYPEGRTAGGYVLYQATEEELEKPVAQRVPPTPLRHYYGYRDGKWSDELYLSSGKADVRLMRGILAEDGFDLVGERILEFGCSAGRLLRHLEAEASEAEVWGVDLHSAAIHWAQAHLSPPFHFCLTTTAPHLPFEDNYFGFIFAGSVWTHIGELDDAWLLEMRRVLRPGGRIYITISDKNTLAEIERQNPNHPSIAHVNELDQATGMLTKPFIQFVTRSTPWLQRAVYDRKAWLAKVGRWFDVRIERDNAYAWQSGVLLAKRVPPEARRSWISAVAKRLGLR